MFDIAHIDRVSIANIPSPIDRLDRLSNHLGGPQIHMKRDDYTGFALGGNKARKLEYLVADALKQGCDTLVTIGGVQSNHCRQTAAAAAKFGLSCHLVLTQGALDTDDFMNSGNVLLDRLTGCELHFVGNVQDKAAALNAVCDQVAESGGKPYAVPLGGSSALGSLGYVSAVAEMRDQTDLSQFKAIVVTTGSAGTHAGLAAGLAAMEIGTAVIGFSCSGSAAVLQPKIAALVDEILALGGKTANTDPASIVINDGYIGPGYGHPTPGCIEAIRMCASLEGIYLDPVYTGKAMAGLIDQIRQGAFTADDKILFMHTGGSPALFGYRSALAD
jgi:D-cysteine desulfhydrase family pyridoxal phosphate-dependent enzyme